MEENEVSIRGCSTVWVVQKTFGKLTVEYRVPKETAATLDELKEFLKKEGIMDGKNE